MTYHPGRAWLVAGAWFAVCLVAGQASGVLAALARPAPRGEAGWVALTLLAAAVVLVAYALIWPRGTFTDGRVRHAFLAPAFGAAWGFCQGTSFLVLWALIERTGLSLPWLAVAAYLAIGAFNAVFHRFFWDRLVAPPHNYRNWNARKVLLCHTPNLVVCLLHFALFRDAAVFVGLQMLALAASAVAMRFPAPWDAYRARAGEER